MTQHEWHASTYPQAMLAFLQTSGRATERKLRLFAVVCCRRIWHLLTDERSRKAVEVAEAFADGNTTQRELMDCWRPAWEVARLAHEAAMYDEMNGPARWDVEQAATAAAEVLSESVEPVCHSARSAEMNCEEADEDGWEQAKRGQVGLLRCIVNPFRTSSHIPASLLTPDLLALAQSLYEARASHRLPELAAALEAAGCTDAELINHLRSPGPHAGRGCWALDAILGKN